MPRIREVTDAGATPAQQALFEQERATHGDVFNTTRVYAHAPELVPPLRAFAQALSESSRLAPELVSLVRVRVAQINGCPF